MFALFINQKGGSEQRWVPQRTALAAAAMETAITDRDPSTQRRRACVGRRLISFPAVIQRGGAKTLPATLSASVSSTASDASALSTITSFPFPKVLFFSLPFASSFILTSSFLLGPSEFLLCLFVWVIWLGYFYFIFFTCKMWLLGESIYGFVLIFWTSISEDRAKYKWLVECNINF